MHDLIGAGVAAARQRRHWTQEQAANRFRLYGLSAWRTSTVGSLEAGLRRPRLDEILLMAAALEVSVADLIPDVDEPIMLGDGAAMSARAVRALLSGDWDGFPRNPRDFEYPGEEAEVEAIERAGAERDRLRVLIRPILDNAALDPWSDDVHRVFLPATDAEAHASRRLNVKPVQVKAASLALWGTDFDAERDARIGNADELGQRSLQARRGLAARDMIAELRAFLRQAYADAWPEDDDAAASQDQR
jgi:transcriptional regulator with XRE-family HTH domain